MIIVDTNTPKMQKSDQSKKISRVLLDLAKDHLESSERHLISEEGIERVKQRLASLDN